MPNLLSKSDNRRLRLIEILSNTKEWVPLSTLSQQLNSSTRALKEDVVHFRKNFKAFKIQLLNQSVRLDYEINKGIKNIYQKFLSDSSAYQLLEVVFLHEGKSIAELEELLFVSSSTLYRLIRQINRHVSVFGFKIETNPCFITGEEQNIRYYFYQYFYEKYSFVSWPFEALDEEALDDFLTFHIELTQLKNDFAYYNKFKMMTAVNLLRFRNHRLVPTDEIELSYEDGVPDLKPYASVFQAFEQAFDIQYNEEAIKQIFTSYVHSKFSVNYKHLMQRAEEDKEIAKEVSVITNTLQQLSRENGIPIPNKEQMISALRNIIHLDYLESQPGYILYNHDKHFLADLKKVFPDFYASIYPVVKDFRALLNKPQTEEGINLYIYTFFTYWKNLIPALYSKMQKIRVVVISNRQATHANLIKEFIQLKFSNQIEVSIYSDRELNQKRLEELPCDLIVANFVLPELSNKRTVYIKNIPFYSDLILLATEIDQIKKDRIQKGREGLNDSFIDG